VLESIGIQGFKAVVSDTLSLGPFTLLIGRNGSGKSSVVEAIQWLRDATFLGLDGAMPHHVEFSELLNRRSERVALDVKFKRNGHGIPVHYTLKVIEGTRRPVVEHERCVLGRTSGAVASISSRKGKRGPAYRWVRAGRGAPLAIRDGNELALRYTQTRGIAGAQDFVDFLARTVILRLSPSAIALTSKIEQRPWRPILAEDGHDLAALLSTIRGATRTRIAKRLKHIFPDVEALDVRATGADRRFAVRERMRSRGGTKPYDIPSSLVSEGMRRLVGIFTLLEMEPSPSLLIIEEVENGLDPWTLQRVLDALREASATMQVLLTSHSPFLLDHVSTSEVIHVERQKGDTTYRPIANLPKVAEYDRVLAPGALYLAELLNAAKSHGESSK